MSTPNPLIPQGTFQAQAVKGASNVRIAVATIVAIHVVFFGGLLLQGCKRDTKTASLPSGDTNAAAGNLTLPPIDSGALFYTNASHLPTESANPATNLRPAYTDSFAPSTSNVSRDPWKPANLGPTGNLPQSDQPMIGGKEYVVVRGDYFGKIAAANSITVNALRKANPTVNPSRLRPGMKLQIPAATLTMSTGGEPSGGTAASGEIYTVKSGDTLTKVAKTYHVTVSQLRAANNLKTSGIKVGQKLKIPPPSVTRAPEAVKNSNITTQTGSTRSNTNAIP